MAQTFNLTADGSTTALPVYGNFTVAAFGTWGSGSLVIQASFDDGTTWIDLTDANGNVVTLTSNTARNVEVGFAKVRVTLSGATSPDLDIVMDDIKRTSNL